MGGANGGGRVMGGRVGDGANWGGSQGGLVRDGSGRRRAMSVSCAGAGLTGQFMR